MSVLKFGVPLSDRLVCDNPACGELATGLIKFKGLETDHFTCAAHVKGLTHGRTGYRFVQLTTPGERNIPESKGTK
jgi:hypothetical protein